MNKPLKMKIRHRFLRQEDFAKKVGVSLYTVSRVIHGKRSLSDKEKKAWSHALNCRVGDIFK